MINIDSRIINEVDANEFFLLASLANRMDKNKTCFPSNKTLCSDMKWSKEKLQTVKKSLVAKGFLEIKGRFKPNDPGQTSNIYRILTPQVGNYTPGGNIGMGEVGKAVSPPVGNSDYPPVGESGRAPVGKPGNEVLTTEVLETEELTNEELKREKYFLSLKHSKVFKEIILFVYPHLNEFDFDLKEELDEEIIKDPTTLNLVKKIRGAARALYSAFENMNKPIPAWRFCSMSFSKDDNEPDPQQDAIDQLQSYAEFCKVTKTHMVTNPENLTEKILHADWCLKLREYADERFPSRYDPMDDFDGSPDWIMSYFYEQQMFWVDKRNERRMF